MEGQKEVLERLRRSFEGGRTRGAKYRRGQLEAVVKLIHDNEAAILEALHRDLRKPHFETVMSEIDITLNEANFALNHLESWMQPEYVSKNLATKFDDCFIRKEPLGVVLIIGAWNYPLQVILVPLVAAIAAGNCAILKPSEVSGATEKLLAELVPKYLDQDCYAVLCGGAEETKDLLKNRFDHIFYTGSQAVARHILLAAAPHLTPVTLELGGKSPCVLWGGLDIPSAARRLAWAKFFNAGQSCVAPDYVLCHPKIVEPLLAALKVTLEEFYGAQPRESPHYGRMVADRHWDRVKGLLERSQGRVAIGGDSDKEDRYIAPTVLVDVDESDSLMEEEIFGPVLPILTIPSLDSAVDFINRKDKPLALYVFSESSEVVTTVLERASSGGFCSNDGMVQMTLPGLPFGGVGASGMGRYHGRWGFDTFSHSRAVMLRGWGLERVNVLRYPPYTPPRLSWLRWATTISRKDGWGCSVM